MRLTRKDINIKEYYFKSYTPYGDCYKIEANKLGKLEDIEEELGIDLITLFKVLKSKKVYHKKYGYYDRFSIDTITKKIWFNKTGALTHFFEYLKDYGITWSLTKREKLK